MATRLLTGAVLGAAVMYLFDPDRGRRRRALLRDKLTSGLAQADDAARVTWRDARNRMHGIAARARAYGLDQPPEERVLIERVRSHVGRAASHPKAVHVLVDGGRITLQGAILEHERTGVLKAVRSTEGVHEVIDRLHGFERGGHIPSLQGGRDRQQLAEWRQANWSPTMRLLAGAGALGLLAVGFSQRGAVRGMALSAASALLLRAATNEPLGDMSRQALQGGVDVSKTITIDAPLEQVFETMAHYENFPQFMRNVRRVELRPDGTSHWHVAGPAGVNVEWDAETTQREPGRFIAWRSLPGSEVQHEGSIRFEEADRGTRVTVRMQYRPPAGALGHVAAKLLGSDAQSELDEDLVRLKTTLETGRTPRDAAARREAARAS